MDTSNPEIKQKEEEKKMPEVYFEDLDLSDNVLDALYDMRFEKCTPVQAQCIPPILNHHDVLGVAQQVLERRPLTYCPSSHF